MIPLLAVAIAIQNEPDPVKCLVLLDGLNQHTRGPVIAWLEADARRTALNRYRTTNERARSAALLAYVETLAAVAP